MKINKPLTSLQIKNKKWDLKVRNFIKSQEYYKDLAQKSLGIPKQLL